MEPRALGYHQLHVKPALNLDVFRTVLKHLSVADLTKVVVVSHLFHEDALREILIRGVRFHGYATKLKAFCTFMLKRDPPLFPFLRSVDIDVVNLWSDGCDPNDLLEVLSHATYLRDLRMRWMDHLSNTSDYNARLRTIISELQHLRHLSLSTHQNATDNHIGKIVLNLRSQLDTLEAFHTSLNWHVPHNFGEHQTHLRVLRMFSPDLASIPWVPLLSVRTLELIWRSNHPIILQPIVRTFPCLRKLAICLGLPWASPHVRNLLPDQVHARDDALAFQQSGGGWKSLDMLTTSTIPEAWLLGLECPVGSARLGPYHIEDHAVFVDVVSKARPKRLAIALECAKNCVHLEGGQSIFLFPTDAGPGTGTVTHAVVFLMLHIVRNPAPALVDQSTSGIIEIVGSHVKHSRLEYLHVAIAVESAFGPDGYASPSGRSMNEY